MGVDQAHLVLEALGDTGNHVLDVGSDCADTGVALAFAEPEKSAKLSASLENLQVHLDMLKRALERATGSGHLHNATLRLDGDCATWLRRSNKRNSEQAVTGFRNVDCTRSLDRLHRVLEASAKGSCGSEAKKTITK